MFKLIGLYLILCYTNFCLSQSDPPQINTPLGTVRGFWKTSRDGRQIAAFEGIPFAKPPIGDLRFEEAQPVEPWSDIWEANTTYICIQNGLLPPHVTYGQEDCLYLNVYIPAENVNNTRTLDVFVYIHGGAFVAGNGHMMADSEYIMEKDYVLVSMNYRLAIFGFLSTEDGAIPGNDGLKDQTLALKWVRDNIASFGGNPNSVTIAGVSAGGASVHFHYISPLSEGLFHRGISQSGTVIAPWSIKKDPLVNTRRLAALAFCPDQPSEELKSCLKQRPADVLMNQIKDFYGYDILPMAVFAPVVEKGSKNPFIDKDPYVLLKEGKVHDVPWITSNTGQDGLLPSSYYWNELEEVDSKWSEIFPHMIDCNATLPESKREEVAEKILEFYLGPGERINQANFLKFAQIFTDRLFALPAEIAAKMQANVTKSPVHYFVYNYRDSENKAVLLTSKPGFDATDMGACHGDDGVMFYGYAAVLPLSEQDNRLRLNCLDFLHSYVTTSDPSFDGTEIWQPTGPSELTYLEIFGPNDFKLNTTNNLAQSEFWSSLGLLENENAFAPGSAMGTINIRLGWVQTILLLSCFISSMMCRGT